MPHASDSEEKKSWNYVERAQLLNQMLQEGRSWSGHERNCCFLNFGLHGPRTDSTPQFANISAVSGLDFLDDGRAMVPVDWDQDGDLDLWTSNRNAPRLRFMQNRSAERVTKDHPANFLLLKLLGNGTTTNRDAIGARVEITLSNPETQSEDSAVQVSDTTFIKSLRAGEGFLSQGSKWLHFGLGKSSQIDKVVVRWPGGDVQEFMNLEPNRRYRLTQDISDATLWERSSEKMQISTSPQDVPLQTDTARIPLIIPLPLPSYPYLAFGKQRQELPVALGEPLLLNLWASWCTPCLKELREFTDREQDLRKRGLNIVALSVDDLGDHRSDVATAEALISKLGFPFLSGSAEEPFVNYLQSFHNLLMPTSRPLPLPTSFLLDGAGRVQFVYKGPVGVTTLLNDLDQIERMENANRHERFEWSAGRDGIAIDQEQVKQSRDFSEVKLRFQFASLISKVGQFEEAANQYRKIIRIAPRFAKAYNSLGLAFYNMRGNDLSHKREAIRYYEKSRELDPNEAQVHYNLGIVHLDFKQPAKAKKHFENAIRLKPNNADAQCDLGTAMAMFGDLPGAIVQFKKALEIDPDHRARSNLELAHQLLSK